MNKQEILERTNKEIEALKKNVIEAVEKEEIVPATGYLMTLRDMLTQKRIIEYLDKMEEEK